MSNEVAVVRQQLDNMEGQFKAALPKHIPVERFVRVCMTAVQNNPDLLNVNRRSFFNAAMRAAQDGLLPDGRDGAIVKYGSDAQWLPMVGGLRKKVRNSGEIATWDVQVVHKNDHFEFELGDEPFIKHRPVLSGEPGDVIAAYSVATLKSGEKSREVMTRSQIDKVRNVSRAKAKGPWVDWFEEMCRKTVARRHSKLLPMSSDLDDLIRRDDELYDMAGAREESRDEARRPKLVEALDRIAGPAPTDDEGSVAVIDETELEGDSTTATEPVDPLQVAQARGREAKRTGMARRAVPGEYRDEARKAEHDAYMAGFDEAEAA